MGISLWLASGTAVWALARIVPLGRRPGWLAELVLSVLTALLLGVLATAMDFGGWQEPDWRAGVFAAAGAFAVIGIRRAISEAVKKSRVVRVASATRPDARRADEAMRGHRGGGATKQMASSRRNAGRSGCLHWL